MNRREILFVYDAKYTNPNGDPLDENKPRMDYENNINLVSDVRLKRTIRDYLADYKSQNIFVKAETKTDGNVQTLQDRLVSETNIENETFTTVPEAHEYVKNELFDNYIDIRLFGSVIAPGKSFKIKVNGKNESFGSIPITAPVQFNVGKSLHKTKIEQIKGTGAFASGDGKDQNTFRVEYVIPYSLIAFQGIVNENVGKLTQLSPEDIILLRDGIWNGTRNLITRSKFGQLPRIYLEIEYCEENFFIGDLNNRIKLTHDLKDDTYIRSIDEVKLDLTQLLKSILYNKDKISKIYYKFDEAVQFKDYTIESLIGFLNENKIITEEVL